jgi:hypothetical protein
MNIEPFLRFEDLVSIAEAAVEKMMRMNAARLVHGENPDDKEFDGLIAKFRKRAGEHGFEAVSEMDEDELYEKVVKPLGLYYLR